MRINEDFIDRISDDDMTLDVNLDESPKGVHPELYDRMLLLTSNSPITKTMLSHLCHRYEVLTNSDDYIAEVYDYDSFNELYKEKERKAEYPTEGYRGYVVLLFQFNIKDFKNSPRKAAAFICAVYDTLKNKRHDKRQFCGVFLNFGRGLFQYFRIILPSTASEFLRDGQSDDITSRCLFGDLKTFFGAYKESDGIVFNRLKEFCNQN
jgi:hypothetical protein